MRIDKMKLSALLFTGIILSGCSLFRKQKDDKIKSNLFTLAAVSNESSNTENTDRDMYRAFADIPASIYTKKGSIM